MRITTQEAIFVTMSPPCDDSIEECYINLIVAIFKQAKSDMRHPGYRLSAWRWLNSEAAAYYATLLGVNLHIITGRILATRKERRSCLA